MALIYHEGCATTTQTLPTQLDFPYCHIEKLGSNVILGGNEQ